MNLAETSQVLAFAARCDNRRPDDATAIAWHSILGDLPFADCLAATRTHYATSEAYLMPVHIRRGVEHIARERRKAEREAREAREAVQAADVRALPSRFEDDVTRTVRVQAGVSHAREVIAPLMEVIARRRAADAEATNPHFAGFRAPRDAVANKWPRRPSLDTHALEDDRDDGGEDEGAA